MVYSDRGGIAIFCRVVGAGLTKKVLSERRLEVDERLHLKVSWGRALQAEKTASGRSWGERIVRHMW